MEPSGARMSSLRKAETTRRWPQVPYSCCRKEEVEEVEEVEVEVGKREREGSIVECHYFFFYLLHGLSGDFVAVEHRDSLF